jgi:predicted N-acetyltransferase YhbS
VSEALDARHRIAGFDSGQPPLDIWLARSAAHGQAMRTARTFVWHGGDDHVVAYFSLVAHTIVPAEVPRRLAHGAPRVIPAVLIARLALARHLQGQGLGGELLWDALSRTVAASDLAGARLVVVDAVDEKAAAFYRYHGFAPVPGNPFRLVQKVSDVAAALAGKAPRRIG